MKSWICSLTGILLLSYLSTGLYYDEVYDPNITLTTKYYHRLVLTPNLTTIAMAMYKTPMYTKLYRLNHALC